MSATLESSPITRWVVLTALTLATAVMFTVSMRGNFLFGYSIGQTEEKRLLFGWANVAADAWKAFGLIAVTVLWRTHRRRAAVLGMAAWLTCLLFGVNSALGVYVQDRTTLVGTRAARQATLRDVEGELSGIEQRLSGRSPTRGSAEIRAEIARALAGPVVIRGRLRGSVGEVSKACTNTEWRTRAACQEVARLREEEAAAGESETLDARAQRLRKEVIALRARGGTLPADPIGEFYAWLTGGYVSVRDVGFGFPLFFALLIEIVSAFGPTTVVAYLDATRSVPQRAMAEHGAVARGAARSGTLVQANVVAWLAERAVPVASTRAIEVDELHADYAAWCAARGSEAAGIDTFEGAFDEARELPELAGKIRKFGRRYYGIGLAKPRAAARRLAGGRA